ncbi:crossover junction endodeoxyribonuclease RuvC [Rickettsiella massiliensis]|uniref:crossover junction endodeoxyribonuclease RuvC n=1 Tax=Rickettsiella massiliensis TaxID=676517 RepID=UPI000299DF98|nr:crossover junction endodeoxyribonuclease RuvC [Rickettsiella massiliensis]
MTVILGIDPGSRLMGYGIIRHERSESIRIASGCIKLPTTSPFATRLKKIFIELQEIIQCYAPTEAAIEQVFFHINPNSALKLGQARGAALVAAAVAELAVHEYSARQVKQSMVGYGAATKQQIQHMVRLLLKLEKLPQEDEADALAIALCHAQSRSLPNNGALKSFTLKHGFRRGRMR